jgi:hypothetical protein
MVDSEPTAIFDVLDELFGAERTPAESDTTDQLDTMTQS